MANPKKVILVIMDGWGLGKEPSSDAIKHSNTPFVNELYKKYPNTTLITYGEDVGLPEGQMGNSEVGHLNLGAGRIVNQELQRINLAIKGGSFFENPALVSAIRGAKKNGKALHPLGLVSDGGVHSHLRHLKAMVDACLKEGLTEVYIHAFTDGRDTDPKSGLRFIRELQQHLNATTGKIATVSGRYYAMDRDKRWGKGPGWPMTRWCGVREKRRPMRWPLSSALMTTALPMNSSNQPSSPAVTSSRLPP